MVYIADTLRGSIARVDGYVEEGSNIKSRKEIEIGIDCSLRPCSKDNQRLIIKPNGDSYESTIIFPTASLRASFLARIRGVVENRTVTAGECITDKLNPVQNKKLNIFTGTWNTGDIPPPTSPDVLQQWVKLEIK